MLRRLSVENFALIERLNVEFDANLNIITGETGAGKSILMGALALLLGAKNDSSAIKDSTRNCVVEGEFDIAGLGLEELFAENDIDPEGGSILLRRVISPSGKSRAYVEDCPVGVAFLKELSSYLIDIHSQHQTLLLSSEAYRRKALDTVADSIGMATDYRALYDRMAAAFRRVEELEEATKASRKDEEWLRYQVEELTSASLHEGETEELEAELSLLENAGSVGEAMGRITTLLDDEEHGILSSLGSAENLLKQIAKHYGEATSLAERIRSTAIELRDINTTLVSSLERLDADPERLERVSERLNLLYDLCRKHRVDDISQLLILFEEYKTRLDAIDHSDELLSEARREAETLRRETMQAAKALHDQRAKAAPLFAQNVVELLSKVGMEDARLEVNLQEHELWSGGIEEIHFLFSANRNVEPRAIERIASGGELSRVMLAIKAVLARRLAMPTIIFDEIDTGVSGRVASAVGEIINDLSTSMQVIDITHLPQVASQGRRHFHVYKEQSRTQIKVLSPEERVEEIAKMLSGTEITAAALEQARILLGAKR